MTHTLLLPVLSPLKVSWYPDSRDGINQVVITMDVPAHLPAAKVNYYLRCVLENFDGYGWEDKHGVVR